jgi:hypothetical protein
MLGEKDLIFFGAVMLYALSHKDDKLIKSGKPAVSVSTSKEIYREVFGHDIEED